MSECARCGAFTDNPAERKYHYCDDCHATFDAIRENGVVIQPRRRKRDYQVIVTADIDEHLGGREPNQVEAIARGKYIADRHGLDAMFEYHGTGSLWLIDEYMQAHPDIRRKAVDRISRVPDKRTPGLIRRLFRWM